MDKEPIHPVLMPEDVVTQWQSVRTPQGRFRRPTRSFRKQWELAETDEYVRSVRRQFQNSQD